jgi:tRNA A37 threonylcarbamoyladenosine dehydratase
MSYEFARLEMLIGESGVQKLKESTVAVFGIGGVGSFSVEALARSAVGKIILVDFDKISESNINRQIHSLWSTVGLNKADVMEKRIKDINPECEVVKEIKLLKKENIKEFFEKYRPEFVIDAIDIMKAKAAVIEYCSENDINIISSMGFGNKMFPEMIEICDIFETRACPLARTLRKVLRKKGIKKLPVVFSSETPMVPDKSVRYKDEIKTEYFMGEEVPAKITPGSNSFVPSAAGIIAASYVIRKILNIDRSVR